MYMIPRLLRSDVERALSRQAAVLLSGPRQSGKTTLALEIARERGGVYLDLEDRDDRAKLAESRLFLDALEDRLVVLDEIHRTPELFASLRGVIDRGRRRGKGVGRFLILGSASIALLKQASESLAGRVEPLELMPFFLAGGWRWPFFARVPLAARGVSAVLAGRFGFRQPCVAQEFCTRLPGARRSTVWAASAGGYAGALVVDARSPARNALECVVSGECNGSQYAQHQPLHRPVR